MLFPTLNLLPPFYGFDDQCNADNKQCNACNDLYNVECNTKDFHVFLLPPDLTMAKGKDILKVGRGFRPLLLLEELFYQIDHAIDQTE